jgi:hypothetical protein
MRQRTTRSAPPDIFHTPGETNILADVASRVIKSITASNPCAFLSYFNDRFPLPQSPSWQLVTLDSSLSSNVILTLRGQQLELRRWTTKQGSSAGTTGSGTLQAREQTPISKALTSPDDKPCSLPLPPRFELACSEAVGKLDTSQWRKAYITWRKPSDWLGKMTHDELMAPKSLICPSGIS